MLWAALLSEELVPLKQLPYVFDDKQARPHKLA